MLNVSDNRNFLNTGLVINIDKILVPEDIEQYKEFIDERVSKIVIDGKIHFGNLYIALHQARRGWLIRGLHYYIAEKSIDHSRSLDGAGTAYSCNRESDVSLEILSPLFKVHDYIDGTLFDITPSDNITKEMKHKMELYGMKKLYDLLDNGTGDMLLSYHNRFASRKIREAVVGGNLDAQCAITKSREYRNRFDDVRKFYLENSEARDWLLKEIYPEKNSLDSALDRVYDRLGEFYNNGKKRITEPFFRYISDEVENFKGADVYPYYFNLLSTVPISDFKKKDHPITDGSIQQQPLPYNYGHIIAEQGCLKNNDGRIITHDSLSGITTAKPIKKEK